MKKLAWSVIILGLVLCCARSLLAAGGFPNPGSAPVTIANPPSKPAPVVVEVTQPVTILYSAQFAAGDWGKALTGVYTVPSNKRLVIEYISYKADLPVGQELAISVLNVPGIPGT